MPADDKCNHRASSVTAQLFLTNHCTPVLACRLNSNVLLRSGGPIPVAVTPAPPSRKGIQRVPVAKLYRRCGVRPTSHSLLGANSAPPNNSPRISQFPRYQWFSPFTPPIMQP